MIEINLLPWRNVRRIYEDRVVKQMVFFSLAIATMIGLSVIFTFSYYNSQLRKKILFLRTAIVQLEKMSMDDQFFKKNDGKIINHDVMFKFFQMLKNSVREELCFTEIDRVKNNIQFVGRARSASDFTNFMRAWPMTSLFADIKVKTLQMRSDRSIQFRFSGELMG